MRQMLEEIRRHQRDHAEADRDRDHEQVVAIVLEVDRVRMRAPVAATMPNMTSPAPPSTTSGTDSTSADIFGSRPRSSMITPPQAVTQRERTPVTPTSPTFCENEV